eukprot:CAMPEP_0175125560 /NCGR_PEP_ID=MMETSP0087-20121206/3380_1 /TAXON_ID=136419 /ORGANISM="Unknown Unknown, Strain D1" /LENGTH=159 /DNA_ID=CAMNT_0016407403 /DNA_START=47 /DNA_END=526 /DNA_ORIENTATION=+
MDCPNRRPARGYLRRKVGDKWYWSPEDTLYGRLPSHGERELFESTHVDENPVACIAGRVWVLSKQEYESAKASDPPLYPLSKVFWVQYKYNDDTGEYRMIVGTRERTTDQKSSASRKRRSLGSNGVDVRDNEDMDVGNRQCSDGDSSEGFSTEVISAAV